MKQRRFGQKVQNWHRPLHPNELSAHYRRLRKTPAGVLTQGGISQELPEIEYDDYDDRDYWGWDCEGPDSPILHNNNLVWSICHPNRPLSALGQLFPNEAFSPPLAHCPPEELIELLAEHVERIQTYRSDDPELAEVINDVIGNEEARKVVQQYSPRSAEVICLFAPFWVRSPLTWNQEYNQSLEEHLFTLYPAPPFLALTPSDSFNYKWLCWLILLGRSISLKAAARVFDWVIPGKLPHYLMQADVPVWSPVQGVIYAEILRLGGLEQDFRRIIADASYQIDITDPDISEADLSFWREAVLWLMAHRGELTDTDAQWILAWARHCYTEGLAGRGASFSWSGRSVRVARERAEVYRQEQQAWLYWGGKDYTWSPHGWDWKSEDGWSITELTSSRNLAIEGAAMHHCVGSYGWRCYTDASSIFSVCYQDQRQVTVELNPQTKTIVQIHGLYNRNATPEERAVVIDWLGKVVSMPKRDSPSGNRLDEEISPLSNLAADTTAS
ncbi:MAG: PcfJ domain-containing protein [Armatimonas sp.]